MTTRAPAVPTNVKQFFYFYLILGSSRFVSLPGFSQNCCWILLVDVKDSSLSWLTETLGNLPADPHEDDWCHIGLSVLLIET